MADDAAVPNRPTTAASSRTRSMVAAALIAALMAALGPIALPAGAVPITLQIFPVVLAALLLTPGWAAASMGLYLVLGALGLPVYAHGGAGIGVLLGPTGGYIFGFVAGAALGSWGRVTLAPRTSTIIGDVWAAVLAIVGVYALGWAWLAFGPAHLGAVKAFLGGVVGFIVPDAIKALVAIVVATAVRRALASR